MTEFYISDCGSYDTVFMIVKSPLIMGNIIIKGFTSIQIHYNEIIKPNCQLRARNKLKYFSIL